MESFIKKVKPNFSAIYKFLSQSLTLKIYLLAVLLYFVSCIIQPNYLSGSYFMSTLVLASFLGVLSIGQTLVILLGGIDLSIIITFNLAAVMITANVDNPNQFLVVVMVLLVCAFIGLINGLGITLLKVTPIVMTLAMQSILTTVLYLYTDGMARGKSPEWLRFISTESIGGVRVMFIVWILIAIVIWLLLNRTTFGRRLYGIGNNPNVTFYSGINNNAITVMVYVISSVCAGLAGMLYAGYLGHSYLGMGTSFLLPSIAAVVIGGTSILGGKGSYSGTIPGAIILYILIGLLTNLNVEEAGRKIINGLIILVVVLLYRRFEEK
jgi:ribose transport system permease protein